MYAHMSAIFLRKTSAYLARYHHIERVSAICSFGAIFARSLESQLSDSLCSIIECVSTYRTPKANIDPHRRDVEDVVPYGFAVCSFVA